MKKVQERIVSLTFDEMREGRYLNKYLERYLEWFEKMKSLDEKESKIMCQAAKGYQASYPTKCESQRSLRYG